MKKRLKTNGSLDQLMDEESGKYSFSSLTHSHLLTQAYRTSGEFTRGYLYQFVKTSGEYGIIFPFEMVPLPYKILKPCSKRSVSIPIDKLRTLQKFQWDLWKDLILVPLTKSKENTLTNYYIVPLKDSIIDWNLIDQTLRPKDMKSSVLPSEVYPGAIVQSLHKTPTLWKVIDVCNIQKTQTVNFITTLLGKDSPGLQSHINKYRSLPLQDFILTNPLKVSSLDSLRKLYKPTDKSFQKDFALLFVKPYRDVRRKPNHTEDQEIYPNGLQILNTQQVKLFSLNSSSIENLSKVYLTLHKIEEYSYFLELCMKYDFKADDFYLIKQACTCPVKNQKTHYESLENLGDNVLKLVTSLHYFVNNSYDKEGKLTWERTNVVCNLNLTEVSIKERLFVYLKSAVITETKVRPAHFNVDWEHFGNRILHRFSSKMLADHVEALIGAFYLAKGVRGAIDFLHKLNVVKMTDTWMRYLEATPLNLIHSLSPECLEDSFFTSELTTDQLFPVPKIHETALLSDQLNLISLPLGYKFKNVSLLEEALTHKSFNCKQSYDRLEFLGDALLDLIIMDNVFCLQNKYTPEELTLIKHMLVNNNQFSKCGVVLELYRYLKCCRSVRDSLDEYLLSLNWKEDIFDFGVYNEDPPKEMSDMFESFIAAVFLDSRDLDLTSCIAMEVLAKPILYIVKNKHKVKVNILSDLSVLCQRRRKKTRFEYQTIQDLEEVRVYDEHNTLISQAAHKIRLCAKVQAAKEAIKVLT